MKYQVTVARYFYEKDDPYVNTLKDLGFTFHDYEGQLAIEKYGSVRIRTLEEMHEFNDTHGSIVLSRGSITIYNDYLE